MKVNDIIKTKSGNLYTIQRAERLGKQRKEYLVLYEVNTGNLAIGYVENDNLLFVTDPDLRMELAKEFDKKKK